MTGWIDPSLFLDRPRLYFVEMDWAGKIERVFTGLGVYEWQPPGDSEVRTWYGSGALGSFTLPESSGEVQASEMVFELSGVDREMVDENGLRLIDRVGENIRGGEVTIWLAFMSPIDFRIEVSQILQSGVLDTSQWIDDRESSRIVVTARGDFAYLENQIVKKWSAEQQNAYLVSLGIDPETDTGFDLMHTLQDKTVSWID